MCNATRYGVRGQRYDNSVYHDGPFVPRVLNTLGKFSPVFHPALHLLSDFSRSPFSRGCIMPLVLLSPLFHALSLQTAAVPTPRAPAASTPSCRREVLAGAGVAAAVALLGLPSRAQASYALGQAAQDSYLDRKSTGFVPVATDDKATIRGIQSDIADKRPQYRAVKAKKKPAQYCAGQTSSVTPMLENICEEYGLSKADQSNTAMDEYGSCGRWETERAPPWQCRSSTAL